MTDPAFIPHNLVAERLGIGPTTFYKYRSALEAEGFPRPDPIINRYHREDVEAWIKSRRRVADPDMVQVEGTPEINFDAL